MLKVKFFDTEGMFTGFGEIDEKELANYYEHPEIPNCWFNDIGFVELAE